MVSKAPVVAGTRPVMSTVSTSAPRNGLQRRAISFVALILAVVLWAAAAWLISDNILPSPFTVFGRMIELVVSGEVFVHFFSSIQKILAGFGLALLFGIPIGFAIGKSQFMAAYFAIPLFTFGNIPGLTYAVFGLVVFGIGAGGPITVSAMVALPFIALNVAEGVRSVDGGLLRMCRAYKRPFGTIVRHVYAPALAAFVFSGVRYGFAMAWKVEALTEVFGAGEGVGFMIKRAYQEFHVGDMLAWTMFFVIVMLLIEQGLNMLEKRIFAWRKDLA
ncbi:MAG: Binding-protein-dependent transport system inner rane component [Homoserinimonas sp.]|jgi:NitT/TauT family transport system permease protein|nr:Binding-protein-dependent transport system inner rane component [Homoserinimonas sp.]